MKPHSTLNEVVEKAQTKIFTTKHLFINYICPKEKLLDPLMLY